MIQSKLNTALALILSAVTVHATPTVYVLTDSQQFGTVDLSTGSFSPVGPGLPDGSGGLINGPGGTLLTLSFSGNLNSINRTTGVSSLIGPTGLGDCSQAASPCGLNSANGLGSVGNNLYATDFANHLYSVDPTTGAATLIGSTGLPALPFIPHSPVPGDPDGSFYFYDETFFSNAGKLYATFDTGTFDPTTFTPTQPLLSANLYQINTSTGLATTIAPTTFGMSTILNVNGTIYAFDAASAEVLSLDLSNGNTTHVADFDPSVGIVNGAVAASQVPEPASLALVGSGLAAMATALRKARSMKA